MKALLREPLVHFLLGGALLFLLFGEVAGPAGSDRRDRIVVGEDRVAMLVRSFERTWMRAPTEPELRGLVDDYVTEEVLYREALALGLDQDDLVVRRRMRQKMEFLNDGLTEREPSDEELNAFLASNPERFRVAPRTSFVQVFVSPDAAAAPEARAERLLAQLLSGADPEVLGDATLLPRALTLATPSQVGGTFGSSFADALGASPEGVWSGPVASSFGLHLVRVAAREPGRLPLLAEVRGAVAREWAAGLREKARTTFYRTLRERYTVEVQMPDAPAPDVAGGP